MGEEKGMMPNISTDWTEVHYVDIYGRTHALSVRTKRLFDSELYIDGSSVGLAEISDSDLHLVPDLHTVRKLPWNPRVSRVIAEIWNDGTPFWAETRRIATKTSTYLKDLGYVERTGVEIEFFLHKVSYLIEPTKQYVIIHNDEYPPRGHLKPKNSYEYPDHDSDKYEARMESVEYLDLMGVSVSLHHHEVAPNQYEISTGAGSIKEVGDSVVTVKYVVRYAAKKHGYVANFMPKPISEDNGSGMHTHLSLWSGTTNLFDVGDCGKYDVSQLARYFIGGVLYHGRSLSALVAPTVNSYKRLLPGYEAPIYLAWGFSNRSAAIRVPKTSRSDMKRIEFRVPDPSANPYLAISAIFLAGLDGIKKKIDPGDPVSKNIYRMSEWELKELGINSLPKTLMEALEELENDNEYLKPIISGNLLEMYIEKKKEEALKVCSAPTPAEYAEYLMW